MFTKIITNQKTIKFIERIFLKYSSSIFLFHGLEGIGKKTLASIFAINLLRFNLENSDHLTQYDFTNLNFSNSKAYNLFSLEKNQYIEVRVEVDRENPTIPTVEGLWKAAEWHERESYDLFGINYEGHSDLRRILLPNDWEGYPLRKDFVTPEFYNGMPVPKDKSEWD